MVCGILVHQPGMEQAPPAVEAWRLNHWTTRGVPTPESEAHKEKAVEGKWPSRLGRVCEAGPSSPQEQLCWQHQPHRLWGKLQEADAPRSSPGPEGGVLGCSSFVSAQETTQESFQVSFFFFSFKMRPVLLSSVCGGRWGGILFLPR